MILENSQNIVTGFVIWPPSILSNVSAEKWPSDEANHICVKAL